MFSSGVEYGVRYLGDTISAEEKRNDCSDYL